MALFPSYSTGTVSIAIGAVTAVFTGATLNANNARGGDTLIVAGHEVGIYECPTLGSATIDAWPAAFGALVNVPYKIRQDSPLRFAGAQTALDNSTMLTALNSLGPIFNVADTETVPDPSYGTNGQFAYKRTNGQWWLKQAGVWVASSSPTANRIVLSADKTYYVRLDGSNANAGDVNSAGGAFATLQYAWDYICDNLDLHGHVVTIIMGLGTHTSGLATNKGVVGGSGAASVLILGSNTPGAVVISTVGVDCIGVGALLFGNSQFTIGGITLRTTTSGNAINVSGGGCCVVYGTAPYPIEFGQCAGSHVVGNHNATLFAGTINRVVGGAQVHCASLSNATVAPHNTGLIFVGAANSISFPAAFWDCEGNASLYMTNMVNTNTAAVNTAYPWGLVASGGTLINYPGSTAPFANGAVQEIGSGRYLQTGLEALSIIAGGTGGTTAATARTALGFSTAATANNWTVTQINAQGWDANVSIGYRLGGIRTLWADTTYTRLTDPTGAASVVIGSTAGGDPTNYYQADTHWFGNKAGVGKLTINSTSIIPQTDNAMTCGAASTRWSIVYAATGAINTSDADEKQLNDEPTDALFDAILAVPLQLFQWKEAIERKGPNGARFHYGPTAQAVQDELTKHGIDPSRFGLFCVDNLFINEFYDENIEWRELNEDGEEITKTGTMQKSRMIDTGRLRLGLRLDQFDRLRTEAIRRRIIKGEQL